MAGPVSCPRCNKRLPGEANFCRRCGTGLRARAYAPPPPNVWGGYPDAATRWRDWQAGEPSPAEAYAPREGLSREGVRERHADRRANRPAAVPPRAGASWGGRWWLYIIFGIIGLRACSGLNRTERRWDPPHVPPHLRESVPSHRTTPRYDAQPPQRRTAPGETTDAPAHDAE